MHPDIEELRPRLKEILYDCAVDIHATKAALFLFDAANRFDLVTEYGFRGNIRNAADFNDPIVDRCGRGRSAFFVNGVAAEPRLSEILFESSTDRLLVAPIYVRGKLIGFVDMRDKAAKQPFDNADLARGQQIADRLAELFASRNIFGHRFISLSNLAADGSDAPGGSPPPPRDAPPRPAGEAPKPVTPPSPQQQRPPAQAAPQRPAPTVPSTQVHVPRLASLVLEARSVASRIMAEPPETITEAELSAARDVLRAVLLIPGAVAATFSAFGHLGGVQELVSRSELSDEAKNLIQSKLNLWLSKRGEAGGYIRTNAVTLPNGGAQLNAAGIQKVFTAPLSVGSIRGLYLTVCFSSTPDRTAHELLAVLHGHLQTVIEQSLRRGTGSALQSRIAMRLVEPDFSKYPALRRHSELVATLSETFARQLALTSEEVEQARIAGLVHDVGMRLLDYERLYRKSDPGPEEIGFLREHPVVGAALVEPLLGSEIARIVLCHHERVDGHGYPNQLHGDEIPIVSRVIQICDAWVAMTDADSYQPPEPRDRALLTLANAAGAQFDAELAARFPEVVRG